VEPAEGTGLHFKIEFVRTGIEPYAANLTTNFPASGGQTGNNSSKLIIHGTKVNKSRVTESSICHFWFWLVYQSFWRLSPYSESGCREQLHQV